MLLKVRLMIKVYLKKYIVLRCDMCSGADSRDRNESHD